MSTEKSKEDNQENEPNQQLPQPKAASGVYGLIIIQIITKLFTFLLNQLLIRFISPKIFGIASYLEFITSTILFFSREAVRLSVQRIQAGRNDDGGTKGNQFRIGTRSGSLQSVINFGFLACGLGLGVLSMVGYWQYRTDMFQITFMKLSLWQYSSLLIIFSILLELIIEPVFLIYQFELDFSRRSKFEGLAIFLKCVMTFVVVVLGKSMDSESFEGIGVLAFSFGRFVYSLTLFITYSISFLKFNQENNTDVKYSMNKIYDSKNESSFYFQNEIFKIWKEFFIQMLFKQLLTEGDKLIINYLCTIDEQGIYAVISNYGAIIARLLFQPLEESTRLMFTKILNSTATTSSFDSTKQSFNYLKLISIFYFNLSIMILFAGITNAPFLLQFIIGRKWGHNTDLFDLFQIYIIYIPFLAFNGILEALYSGMASNKDMKRFSSYMIFVSILIVCVSYLLIEKLRFGILGLIIANVINMALRIGFCFVGIKKYYSIRSVAGLSLMNVVKYTWSSTFVMVVWWGVQYLVVFGMNGYTTQSWKQLIGSGFICIGLLSNLLFLERKNLHGPLDKLKSRLTRQKLD
ncbi:RFT1 [[Candida] subhashii]|uniref:Man(5)GlcNAc(2)-PP-dolichol translocation protein RFT1 n=1 Tax=[Candida] subhashii TaxID=561895 RepID=A0A8J5QJC5_9ASCO|nr:RFT1 [[Candida] subhashii]KAG7665796.1 RFT1 [[Candida] subhashii]